MSDEQRTIKQLRDENRILREIIDRQGEELAAREERMQGMSASLFVKQTELMSAQSELEKLRHNHAA